MKLRILRIKQENNDKKHEKEIVLKNLYKIFEAREKFFNGYDSRIFLIKSEGPGISNTDRNLKY